MRIGIDVSALTRRRTGVGQYLFHQLEALMTAQGDTEFSAFSTGRGGVSTGSLPFRRHRHLPVPTRAMYRLWNLAAWPRPDRLLGGLDLFHATNYFLPPVARCARVVTFYDLTFLKHPQWCSPSIVGPFRRNIHRFAREADAILTCSHASRVDIVELLEVPAEKVFVAHGAADPMFQPGDKEHAREVLAREYGLKPPCFLFVSTLEPRKNVEGLLEAFALAAKRLPHRLVLVGQRGWNMRHLDSILTRLELGERILELGYVEDRAHLPLFYQCADALVLPSWYEGFGLPVLEAMQCGCPVITSPNSSLPEVGGAAALYATPGDTQALAAAMEKVASSSETRVSMSAAGLEQARDFTWARCAEATWTAYDGAMRCASF